MKDQSELKKRFLDSYNEIGTRYVAADKAGVSQYYLNLWMKTDPEFKKAYNDKKKNKYNIP